MTWNLWIGLAGLVVQLVVAYMAMRLRREALAMLGHAKITYDQAGRWLHQAQLILAHNEGLLREHGFLADDEPAGEPAGEPTVQ